MDKQYCTRNNIQNDLGPYKANKYKSYVNIVT